MNDKIQNFVASGKHFMRSAWEINETIAVLVHHGRALHRDLTTLVQKAKKFKDEH